MGCDSAGKARGVRAHRPLGWQGRRFRLKALSLWQAQQRLAGRSSRVRRESIATYFLELIGQGGWVESTSLATLATQSPGGGSRSCPPSGLSNPRAIAARFQRESAGLVPNYSMKTCSASTTSGESNGRYFLVMEYHRG